MIELFEKAPKPSAEGLSSAAKHRKAGMSLMEKVHVSDKFPSVIIIVLLAISSMLVSQKYISNEVSLNRNTHKPRRCTDGLMKKLGPKACRQLTLFSPGAVAQYLFIQCSWGLSTSKNPSG